jgi:hypothetical protein
MKIQTCAQNNSVLFSHGRAVIPSDVDRSEGYRQVGFNMGERPHTCGKVKTGKKEIALVAAKSGTMFVLALMGVSVMFAAAAFVRIYDFILKNADLSSLLSRAWRIFSALLDWRTNLRFLMGERCVDVVFISNLRDAKDRKRFMGGWHPPEGHFNGPRYSIKGVLGRTRVLDFTAEELVKPECRMQAKEQFIRATQWAQKMGARVILLAAGTKRLFEGEIEALRHQFPEMVFTLGDNGTSLLLIEETLRALEKAQLHPGGSRIGVLGPYGFLGELMIKALLDKGYQPVGAGPNHNGLEKIHRTYGIPTYRTFEEMGKLDAVVACTHSDKIRLTANNIDLLRKDGRKLLVIDVAEPSNLTSHEYRKCRDRVVRQDAGNAHASGLKYVLGAITYRMFRLTRGVTFGCFAEALTLAWAMKNGQEEKIREGNWMEVCRENMQRVEALFGRIGFSVPSPRCHCRSVTSFELKNMEKCPG